MGQEDLGACVILCQRDIDELKTNTARLKFISKYDTPVVYGLFDSRINRKLRRYVEKEARKEEADVAFVFGQGDLGGDIFKGKIYHCELYQYRKS